MSVPTSSVTSTARTSLDRSPALALPRLDLPQVSSSTVSSTNMSVPSSSHSLSTPSAAQSIISRGLGFFGRGKDTIDKEKSPVPPTATLGHIGRQHTVDGSTTRNAKSTSRDRQREDDRGRVQVAASSRDRTGSKSKSPSRMAKEQPPSSGSGLGLALGAPKDTGQAFGPPMPLPDVVSRLQVIIGSPADSAEALALLGNLSDRLQTVRERQRVESRLQQSVAEAGDASAPVQAQAQAHAQEASSHDSSQSGFATYEAERERDHVDVDRKEVLVARPQILGIATDALLQGERTQRAGLYLLANLLSLPEPFEIPSATRQNLIKACIASASDIGSRAGCLFHLTHHGRDISPEPEIVRVLVGWIKSTCADWEAWCAQETQGSDPSKTLALLSRLLRAIVQGNIHLFSPADIVALFDLYEDVLVTGIKACGLASPTSLPTPTPTPPGGQSVSRRSTNSSINRRLSNMSTGSSSNPLRKTFNAFATEPSLSRSSSLKKQGMVADKAAPSVAATIPRPKSPMADEAIPHPRESTASTVVTPPWSAALGNLNDLADKVQDAQAIPPVAVDRLLRTYCLCLGWSRVDQLASPVVIRQLKESDREGIGRVVRKMLNSHTISRTTERAVRECLREEGVALGGLVLLRSLLGRKSDLPPSFTLRSFQSALKSLAQPSTPTQIDVQVLLLLRDYMEDLASNANEMAASMSDVRSPAAATTSAFAGDPWLEGETLADVLVAFEPLVTKHASLLPSLDHQAAQQIAQLADADYTTPDLACLFAHLLLRMPTVLGSLTASPSLAFVHPEYMRYLLKLAPHLSPDMSLQVLEYYEEEGLCLPPTPDWVENVGQVLAAFYINRNAAKEVRRKANAIMYSHVYRSVRDFASYRQDLVDRVIIPTLRLTLPYEDDPTIESTAWQVLVSVVVQESIERDEQRRTARAKDPDMVEETFEAEERGTFQAIQELVLQMAIESTCAPLDDPTVADVTRQHVVSPEPSEVASPQESASRLESLAEAISPTSRSRELPSMASQLEDNVADAARHFHTGCRSIRAVQSLIAMFTRLAFAPPHSLLASTGMRSSRLPASRRCLTIFNDLLSLLERSGDKRSGPASCPQARLLVLQWMMRLRANKQHRIWIKPALDDAAQSSASLILRLEGDIEENQESRRKVAGSAMDRGRAERSDVPTGRSRSRSRQPARRPQVEALPYRPRWCIPEKLTFECPPDARASDGMTTYNPLESNPEKAGRVDDGIWLPISRYIAVLLDIIRSDPDWELVSYILVFFPLQLTNKHFFCGPRSNECIRELRRLLCDSMVQGQLLSSSRTPQVIKRADVNSVAYQTLTILVSYRRLFTKQEGNAIVEAFQRGLVGQSHAVSKVCIQALTLCVWELAESLISYLPNILQQLSGSSGELGIHLMELLLAIGQNPTLYSNMTEVQYYGVFKLCIDLIQGNVNAKQETGNVDVTRSTQTQMVVVSAYLTIFTWFLALGLPRRPSVASYIIKNIVPIFNAGILDESAEVCFDWLCRYTYANADPKPTVSFLSDIVMRTGERGGEHVVEPEEHGTSKNWVLGNAIITITAQPRSGWVTIKTRRPSGTSSLLCKLENVPLLGLGEDDADLRTVQAVLMADRDNERVERPVTAASGVIDADAQALPAPEVITSSRHLEVPAAPVPAQTLTPMVSPSRTDAAGWVWSGSAPSQRRKEVAIDPGYIGLLLSAYPYTSLEAPRGRLIRPDDLRRNNTSGIEALARTLRNIDAQQVVDTHRIAVLYVAPGQTTEREILGNVDGSQSFLKFVAGLGRLIKLRGQRDVFTGGLDTSDDQDGEYAYAWWDDLNQVVYHAPHLMPNRPTEDGSPAMHYEKKRLVGNDFVTIVFNDSGHDYRFDTIDTQFQFINIVISSHTSGVSGDFDDSDEHDFFKVTVQRRPGIPEFSPIGDYKLVSAKALPLIVRQISLLASHLAQIYQATDMAGSEYITNWRQRYRTIKKLKESLPPLRVRGDGETPEGQSEMWLLRDFTQGF